MIDYRDVAVGRRRTGVWEADGPPGAPTVVLLHGWGATTPLNWPGAFEALEGQFRVLGLDHRGHGRGLRAVGPFTLAAAGQDVIDIADAVGAQRLILVGYSMGGPVALSATRLAPGRVVGLVAAATAARFAASGGRTPDLSGAYRALRSLPAGARRRLTTAMISRWGERLGVTPEQAQHLRGHDLAALWEAAEELGRFDARPWAGELGVPAVSIIPNRDAVVPVRRQRELADLLDARRIVVEGDHRVAATGPATFLPALVQACRLVARREQRPAVPATAELDNDLHP